MIRSIPLSRRRAVSAVTTLESRATPATYNFDAAADLISINLDTNEGLTVSESGGSVSFALSSGSFLAIGPNTAAGDGTAVITLPAGELASSVTIHNTGVGAGANPVTFSGSGSLATASLAVSLTDPGAPSSLAFTGGFDVTSANSIDLVSARDISLSAGTVLTCSGSTGIVLLANSSAATAGNFVGIQLNSATIRSTGTGNVALTGHGGNAAGSGTHHGIRLEGTSSIQSTSESALAGTITVTGTGGSGTSDNMGIRLQDSSAVTSAAGDITLTGTGGAGTANSNHGVSLVGSSVVSSTGTGAGAAAITITGTGGAGTTTCLGVEVNGAATTVQSAAGDITLNGTGGGSSRENHGVHIRKSLLAGGTGHLSIGGTGGTGAAGVSAQTNTGVFVSDAATAAGRTTTVQGLGGAGFGAQAYGVSIQGAAAAVSSTGGKVEVTGTAGATAGNLSWGVNVDAGSITAGGSGSVHVTGSGSAAAQPGQAFGVCVNNSGKITSSGGDVAVTGTGGGGATGEFNCGVVVQHGGQITSGGNGHVSVTGTGSPVATQVSNFGVLVRNPSSRITSGGPGTVTVTGTGGAGTQANHGVNVTLEGAITTGGGAVTVTGHAGTGTSAVGLRVGQGGRIASAASAPVTLAADSMLIDGTGVVVDGLANTVTLVPSSPAANIRVGPTTDTTAGTLDLSDAELDRISAGTVVIGDANARTVTVTAAVEHAGDDHFLVRTGRNIVFDAGAAWATTAGDLTFQANTAGTTAGNFVGVDVNGATLTTAGTGNLGLTGFGGDDAAAAFLTGVRLQNGAVVRSTAATSTAGTISLAGTGGSGTSDNYGIRFLDDTTAVTSVAGDISLTGTGGPGTANSNHGVSIIGGSVASTGTGADAADITIIGNAGGGTFICHGVEINGTETTLVAVDGDVTVTGTGGGTTSSNFGVVINEDVVTTGTGEVVVTGTGGAGVEINNVGISIENAATVAGATTTLTGSGGAGAGNYSNGVFISGTVGSTGGRVEVTGQSFSTGTGPVNLGVWVESGTITAGGTGPVVVTGFGSPAAAGELSVGVYVAAAGLVTSAGGPVAVTGTGGGTGATGLHHGVFLTNGAAVTSGGDGGVTVTGFGGTGPTGGGNVGVVVGDGLSRISSGGAGTVAVTGTGGTGSHSNFGVEVNGTGRITTGGGAITVTGTRGGGPLSVGIQIGSSGSVLTAKAAAIDLIADRMNLNGASPSVDGTGTTVTLRPKTPGVAIDLGSAVNTTADTLELSAAELERVAAGTLRIGDAATGAIAVTAVITRTGPVHLTSGTAVQITTGSLAVTGGDVTLTSPHVTAPRTGTDVTADALAFAAGTDLKLAINGTTVDTQYDQLNVAGKVNLTNVDLVLTGGYVPAAGDSFVLVNNDGSDAITGTFAGLTEGATIVNLLGSGRSATITYTGGDGNDVVLSVVTPPMVAATIDDGNAQRSMVRWVTLTFAEPQADALSNVSITRDGGLSGTLMLTGDLSGDAKTLKVAFKGTAVTGGSLPDGRYTLTYAGGLVLEGDEFFRLFGDLNGDAFVDANEKAAFASAMNTRAGVSYTGGKAYNQYLDYNSDGYVNSRDATQFDARYLLMLP